MASLTRSVGFPSLLRGAIGLIPRISVQSAALPISQRLEEIIREKLGQISDALPTIDAGLWKAAPKKRPSKRRTRENFLTAGKKQVQHMHNLVRCPACGHVKRAHFMCMHCFAELKLFLKEKRKSILSLGEKFKIEAPELDKTDRNIIYPPKNQNYFNYKVNARKWVPKREDTQMHNQLQLKKRTKKTYLEEE